MVIKFLMLYGINNLGFIVRVKVKFLFIVFGDKVGIFVLFFYIGFVEFCNIL